MPSDYRYDPFSDVSTAVTVTERHIVPATSPYVVVLGEIPQRNSPSTMSVKAINAISGGSVTYGATFAEVAAQPAAGEFFPDYNTAADGDKNWNTGKLLFAAADAGKMVEITYTAIGTLASVKANHYPSWTTDRGDGSDGHFCPTANTTISGEKNYKSVYVPSGVTVTCSANVHIKCLGMFDNRGTIDATGIGGAGGVFKQVLGLISGWEGFNTDGEDGISQGGAGGNGVDSYSGKLGSAGGAANPAIISLISAAPCYGYGAGGGAGGSGGKYSAAFGGNGGGRISIVANTFRNTGTIKADGARGGNGYSSGKLKTGAGGGGGGGIVSIHYNTLVAKGNITVTGGAGGSGVGGAGAAGGEGIVILKELGAM